MSFLQMFISCATLRKKITAKIVTKKNTKPQYTLRIKHTLATRIHTINITFLLVNNKNSSAQ